MMPESTVIPVVDFSRYDTGDQKTLSQEVCQILRTIGFMYLENHGIPHNQIEEVFGESLLFFRKSEAEKLPLFRPIDWAAGTTTRYIPKGAEQFNADTKDEGREAFDLVRSSIPENMSEATTLISVSSQLDSSMSQIALKILHCIGIGLHLPDEHFFENCHKNLQERMLKIQAGTMFRSLYYPPYHADPTDVKAMRLGTHSDYGTITLLFQDNVGGLEVETTEGVFVPATPISGTILVNIGDLLQRWTGNQLRATRHRVRCNTTVGSRQSIAMFMHPDEDTMIEPLFGAKLPPVRAFDYLKGRYSDTYASQSK